MAKPATQRRLPSQKPSPAEDRAPECCAPQALRGGGFVGDNHGWVGAALMQDLVVDKQVGFFLNTIW